jgi:hypothetical protein
MPLQVRHFERMREILAFSTVKRSLPPVEMIRNGRDTTLETVACAKLIERRNYIPKEEAEALYAFSEKLFAKLTAFKKAVSN